MNVSDIYNILDSLYPFSLALDFDNCGLLIGSENRCVTKAVVALDCTNEVLDLAVAQGAELIITHHPVIFNPLKSIPDDSLVYKIIKSGISVISAHTNLDTANGGVNDCLANKLGLINIQKITCEDGFTFRKGVLNHEMSPADFAKFASKKLGFSARYVEGNRNIKTVAVCSGSGSDMIYDAIKSGADAFLSSEIKHNVFLYSKQVGITTIDCGHEATEKIIVDELCRVLSEKSNIKAIPYLESNILYF